MRASFRPLSHSHLSRSHTRPGWSSRYDYLDLPGSFAQLLRAALWRSAFVRWAVYRSWAELTGIPITYPIPIPPVDAAAAAQSANETVTTRVQFAFMVYENQRWWMGLDWTAALLPGERPSWCSASQAPLPPPAAFALPAPTTAFLPADGPPDAREQRTATWEWAEPEWRVVVRRDGDSSADAVEGAENAAEETDADGWVYGDNKWESHSGKGGLGKVRAHPQFLSSSSLFVSSPLTRVPCLITVHASPPLDAHRHLDRENEMCGTWTYGRFA